MNAIILMAGEVLDGQTKQIVAPWRGGIIASIPNLARHSRTREGAPNPEYLAKSNPHFEQWILDICLHPYDQDWLNYRQETRCGTGALRRIEPIASNQPRMSSFRDVMAFTAVLNDTIRPYLTVKGHNDRDVAGMLLA